ENQVIEIMVYINKETAGETTGCGFCRARGSVCDSAQCNRSREMAAWHHVLHYCIWTANLGPAPFGLLRLFPVGQLFSNVAQYFQAISICMQFAVHALQRNANDIAMVQLGTEVVTQLEPHVVNKIHVLRPQARRMRPQVHENGWPARRNDFE